MAKRRRENDDEGPGSFGSGKIFGMETKTVVLLAGAALVAALLWKRRQQAVAAAAAHPVQTLPGTTPRATQAATSYASPAQTGAPQGPAMAGPPMENFNDGMNGGADEFGGGRF